MKKLKLTLFLFLLSVLYSNLLNAQNSNVYSYNFSINVYDRSLIRINPSTSFELKLLSSLAGSSMDPAINNSSYLQLTSIPPINVSRRITAKISGTVPLGTMLTLYAVKQSGLGDCGTASSIKTLNTTQNQTIIDGIASGYTGSNTGSGFQLYYTLQVDPANYSKLKATAGSAVTVTYTIVNN